MSSNNDLVALLNQLQECLPRSNAKEFSDDFFALLHLVPQEVVQATTAVCRTFLSRGYNEKLFTQLRN